MTNKPKCFTDYPLFPDEYGKEAPIREVSFIKYDGNKYCDVDYQGETFQIKSGYLYSKAGRLGDVPQYLGEYPELKLKN